MELRRYVVVDYMHLPHKYIMAQPLSTKMNIDGAIKEIDTTLPNYTIKDIYRKGGKGLHNIGVCFEGGASKRKEYFKERLEEGYKGTRKKKHPSFYKGVDLSLALLIKGGVQCYRFEGYEADDFVFTVVKKIKELDPHTPIDVITNDSDLLPLVDEQVSVYIRGKRTYADEGCPEHTGYYQVTPQNWEEYLSYTSAYKNYTLPYNSMLLHKMIRGDKTDEVPAGVKGYGAVGYNKLMATMLEDGVDFPNIFRYGVDFDTVMKPVLLNYFKEEEVESMKYVYGGIGLKDICEETGGGIKLPKPISLGAMQVELAKFRIHL